LKEGDLKKAWVRLRSADYTRVQVAEELEVNRHTLWRALSDFATPQTSADPLGPWAKR
jgi:DNA-binding phage protein